MTKSIMIMWSSLYKKID